MLKGDGVDIMRDAYLHNTEHLIKNARIVDGIPFIHPHDLLLWKIEAVKDTGKEKHQKDIELLEKFLEKENKT